MTDSVSLSIAEAVACVSAALIAAKTSTSNARSTALALAAAEADGQAGHGLARAISYAAQARAGKVNGFAEPCAELVAPAAIRVDGGHGFAYPAIDLAIETLVPLARTQGIAVAAIHRSHHFGQAGAHVERLANAGLIGLLVGNTPKAMAAWGARTATLGTNPLAFAAPVQAEPALVIDLALSVVARSKVVAAQQANAAIPADWALDRAGRPTTDPAEALAGSLLPMGGAKGAALAIMIEVLAAALTGSAFGWEASSFLDDQGPAPNTGHALIAIDARKLSAGRFDARMQALVAMLTAEEGARMPGSRRLARRERARADGLSIPAALHRQILALGKVA